MGLLSGINNLWTRLSEPNRDNIWKVFGSFHANKFAMSGNGLISNSYERNVDVYSIIKKIIDVLKSVDWVIEEKKANGKVDLLTDTTLHELINSPNKTKGFTWNDVEEQLLIYLLCSGNAYLFGQTALGKLIVEVDVLPTGHISIESNRNFFLPDIKYNFQIENTKRVFTKEEIAHLKLFNPSYNSLSESYYGLSPIQVASMVVQSSNDRVEADAALLQNRGAIGLITDKSNRPMTPDEARAVQEDFQRTTAGTHNFGRIKVTNKDLSYIQMAMSSADLQLIEKGVVNLRSFCNLFGLDSSLFNDPENKTYNNRKEAEKAMYTNAIIPLSNKLSEFFTNFLCRNHFPGRNISMRQDFSGIEVLQENFKEKADTIAMLKENGIISAATAADILKQPPLKEPNALLEALSGVSPLLANQLIMSLTEDEARGLLNLSHTDKPTLGTIQAIIKPTVTTNG